MNPLADLLPPALLRALGVTLLHSLWQGTLIGVLAAALLMLLHRHAAVVRYRVAAASLVAMLALAGLTFGHYYAASLTLPGTATPVGPSATLLKSGTYAPVASVDSTGLPHLLDVGRNYVECHLPLLVGAWLLGVVAMLLRFLGELAYVQRLRHYRVAALPAAWQEWLDGLARRAGLGQRVRLLASALVTSPVVVGVLRPVVLLPIGLATGLPTTELEMILAHELAHVLRRDYLFNILQSVAEALFFYHPAVWFLSASIRTERENCCDDVATRLHGDARLLAQALAAVAELNYAATRPRLALAAAGPEGSLLGRVRRLVQHAPTAPTFAEGFGAAVVVMAGLVLLAGSTIASLGAARPAGLSPAAHQTTAAASDSAGLPSNSSIPPGRPTIPVGLAPSQQLLSPAARQPEPRPQTAARQGIPRPQPAQLPATVHRQKALAAADNAQLKRLPSLSPLTTRLPPLTAGNSAERARQADARAAASEREAELKMAEAQRNLHQAALNRQEAARKMEAARQTAAHNALTPEPSPKMNPVSEAQTREILAELHRDERLAPTATAAELLFSGKTLTVNGQLQPAAVATRYRTRLHVPTDATGQVVGSVRVTLNE